MGIHMKPSLTAGCKPLKFLVNVHSVFTESWEHSPWQQGNASSKHTAHPPNGIVYIFLCHSYGRKFFINHISVYHHTYCYVLKYPAVDNLTYHILHGGLSHCNCGLYLTTGPPWNELILSQLSVFIWSLSVWLSLHVKAKSVWVFFVLEDIWEEQMIFNLKFGEPGRLKTIITIIKNLTVEQLHFCLAHRY